MDLVNDNNAVLIRIRAILRDIVTYIVLRKTIVPDKGKPIRKDIFKLRL